MPREIAAEEVTLKVPEHARRFVFRDAGMFGIPGVEGLGFFALRAQAAMSAS
jgi:hypothetical protein